MRYNRGYLKKRCKEGLGREECNGPVSEAFVPVVLKKAELPLLFLLRKNILKIDFHIFFLTKTTLRVQAFL